MNTDSQAAKDAEREAKDAEIETQRHIEHGGWKCRSCGYDGQDNQQYNVFCSECRRHR
jgi:hypothetical protein